MALWHTSDRSTEFRNSNTYSVFPYSYNNMFSHNKHLNNFFDKTLLIVCVFRQTH